MKTMTTSVTANSTSRPEGPYSPVLSTMIPTRLKRKDPRNVANAFCAVLSETSSAMARGVTLLVAEAKAATIVLNEKIVTDNMLTAMMSSRL